jgi:cysteine desulfurase/selenocysteine lyase
MTLTVTTPLDIAAIRSDFPILQQTLPEDLRLVYLDNAATAQKPRVVIDKLVEVLTCYNANANRSAHTLAARVDEEFHAVRTKTAEFLHANSPDEIIFTGGTTAGLNMIAHGWARKFLRPGDELVISLMEHHANFVPWQQAAKATGAALRFFPLTADGRLDLDQLTTAITPQTKLVSLTAMSNVLGTINPLDKIVKRVREVGAILVVDGAQSVPHGPVDVRSLDCDFLVFSGHKLYGPTGVGVLYGKAERLEELAPSQFGGNMIRTVRPLDSDWADLPARFEAGTPPIAEVIALGAAIDYVTALGMDRLAEHERVLTTHAYAALSAIEGLRILGPGPADRGAILAFSVEGVNPSDLGVLLDQRHGVAIRVGHHCAMPLHESLGLSASARASFAVYNTLDEVDALIAGMARSLKTLRRKRT